MTDSINMQSQTFILGLRRTRELQKLQMTSTFIKCILFFIGTVKGTYALHSFLTPREFRIAWNPE